MGRVTTEEITLRLPDLSYDARKEVYDFLNFLLLRQKRKKNRLRKNY